MKIKVTCPKCGTEQKVKHTGNIKSLNKTYVCNKCGQTNKVKAEVVRFRADK